MTKKQTRAQGQEQTQSRPISVPFSHGTLSFDSAVEARKAMGWFTFHNRVVAQTLSEDIANNSDDLERLTSLGFLSRDMADLICAIEIEIGGAA
jgi:hypothetical protein